LDDDYDNTQELHTFADASLKAYGAVVYIQQGSQVSLIMAKTCVAPLRKPTLPKLEPMAALVATKFTKFVADSLDDLCHDMPVQDCALLDSQPEETDSTICLPSHPRNHSDHSIHSVKLLPNWR